MSSIWRFVKYSYFIGYSWYRARHFFEHREHFIQVYFEDTSSNIYVFMKEKKMGSSWWIGLTYNLTASIIPAVIAFVGVGLVTNTFSSEITPPYVLFITSIVYMILLWPGIMYSARFIRKHYAVPNMMEIVLWGTIFEAFLSSPFSTDDSISLIWLSALGALSIVQLIYFYQLSKKYLLA